MISFCALPCVALCVTTALCLETRAEPTQGIIQSLDLNGDGSLDIAVAWQNQLWLGYGSGSRTFTWHEIHVSAHAWHRTDRMHGADFNKDGRDELVLLAADERRVLVVSHDALTQGSPQFRSHAIAGPPSGSDVSPDQNGNTGSHLSVLAVEGSWPSIETLGPGPLNSSRDPLALAVSSEPFPAGRDTGDRSLGFVVLPRSTNATSMAWLHEDSRRGSLTPAPQLTWYDHTPGVPGIHKASDVTLKRGIIGLIPSWMPGDLQPIPVAVAHGPDLGALYVLPAGPDAGRGEVLEISLKYSSIEWQPQSGNHFDGRFLVARDLQREVYRWTSDGLLELEHSVSPPSENDSFAGLGALTEAGLVTLLHPASGSQTPDVTFYSLKDGRLVFDSRSSLPVSEGPSPVTGVLVYDRDPFLDGMARELAGLPAGDWTRFAEVRNGSITARSSTFQDSRTGLDEGTSRELTAPTPLPEGSYALPNQWEPASSLHFGRLQRIISNADPGNASQLSGDSDMDGLEDAWERRFFGHLDFDGAADPDSDGFTNAAEQAGVSDPSNNASQPSEGGNEDVILTLEWTGSPASGLVLRWTASSHRTFLIETSDDLIHWNVSERLPDRRDTQFEWSEGPLTGIARFYRLVTSP